MENFISDHQSDKLVRENSLNYWKNRLDTFRFENYIEPIIHSKSQETFEQISLNIDQYIIEGFKRNATSEKEQYVFLISCLLVLCSRYSLSDDIGLFALNIPTHLKSKKGDVNILLRVNNFKNLSFQDLVNNVERNLNQDIANYDGFEKFLNEVDVDLKEFPLIEFSYFKSEKSYKPRSRKNDFTWVINGNTLSKSYLSYNSARFEKTHAQRIIDQFGRILSVVVNNSKISIYEIEILNQKEKKLLLNNFNLAQPKVKIEKTFLDEFKSIVKLYPENIALKSNSKKLTYRELDLISNQFSSYLLNKIGIDGDLVGINLERSPDVLISIIALFKIKKAYMPIDPKFPEERINILLKEANVSYVIEDSLMKDFYINRKHLDDSEMHFKYSLKDLAYVLFTSGSTGTPKGVMIEHAGLINHLYAMRDELSLNTSSQIAQTAPLTFDISVWQMLNALIVGGTCCFIEDIKIKAVQLFMDTIDNYEINILQLVPSHLKAILDLCKDSQDNKMQSLRQLLVTGEKVNRRLIEEWFKEFPTVPVINAYGPAEASDDVSLYIMNGVPKEVDIPIGKPIQNIRVYILDENRSLCPIGVKGEIYVSGIGVGRGYLNNLEKTKECFSTDPFSNDETRMYKTGDFGKWLDDGNLRFHGRKDEQVKIRGHRIELGEVESIIRDFSNIAESIVVVIKINGANHLVSYYVTNEKISSKQIKEQSEKVLPSYMVPSYFISMEKFPLNNNGKIDKNKLPDPTLNRSIKTVTAPQKEVQQQLQNIWAEILSISPEEIGINNSFFELGGQSLSVMILANRISKELNVELSIPEFFESPTIKDVSDSIDSQLWLENSKKGETENPDNIDITI
jgi:amino acid adenylation domain-containing protein